jgi:hypothetical protein
MKNTLNTGNYVTVRLVTEVDTMMIVIAEETVLNVIVVMEQVKNVICLN